MGDNQYDVTPEFKRLFEEKQRIRAERRAYFLKEVTNPHRYTVEGGETGYDPGVIRYQAMKASQYDFYKPNVKTLKYPLLLFFIPFTIFSYAVYKEREAKEHAYRTGQVAYKDRSPKFV